MQKVSLEQFKKLYGTKGAELFKQVDKKPGFIERTKESAKQGLSKAKEGVVQIVKNPLDQTERNSGLLKIGAGGVETAFSPLTAAVQPVVEPTIGRAVKFAADKISDIPAFQRFADSEFGQNFGERVEDVSNLNTIVGAVVGPKMAGKTLGTAGNIIKDTTTKTVGAVERGLQPAKGFTSELSRIPNRILTNIAEKQTTQAVINKLPTKIARQAAQDGLDVADVNFVYKIPKIQKTPLKQLANTVKNFAEGKTKTNPIEVVGKPIINRIKKLEIQRGVVGEKLGKVADTLGDVTTKDLFPKVFDQLKKVSGLNGLKVSKKGILDFKDTVLATAETATDRAALQEIFMAAIKKGTGKSKHLLRQELFEILGGKKKALTSLTDTQERAFEAIRKGLSDTLEAKSSGYKNLNLQYSKVANPLRDIRKLMKGSVGASEDILDMQAGLLARRLTSLAASNPQIRSILKAMDSATAKSGKTLISVETLQDFYNILEKYYDIAPKTGFQAQIRQGVEKATGITDYAFQKLKSFAGETPAVRQKALENILNEVFK